MRINKKLRNKVLGSLTAVMVMGSPFVQNIGTINTMQTAHASNLTSILGIAGLGMKINDSTRYNYSMPKDLSAMILCRATNAAAQNPQSGETGTYSCHVVKLQKDSKYLFPTGYTTGRLNYSGTGTQMVTLSLGYTLVTDYKDGKPVTETGSIPITIQAKVGKGANTTITNDPGTNWGISTDNGGVNPYSSVEDYLNDTTNRKPSGWSDADSSNNGGNGGNGGVNTNTGPEDSYYDGHGPCYDGTYFCPEESNGSNSSGGINGSLNDNWVDPGDNSGKNPSNLDDGLNTNLPNQKFTEQTDDGGTKNINYGDIIDDMLGDNRNSSYDSPNMDWGSSNSGANGGDLGENNLDGYFNGIEDAGALPDGITVDGDLPEQESDGNYVGDEVYTDRQVPEEGGYVDGNGGSQHSVSAPLGDFDGMPDAYQAAVSTLDGTGSGKDGNGGSSADGIFGDMGGGNSLNDKIKDLLGQDRSVSGNKKGGVSDQDLFDYAKKFLLTNGYTAADIANGKNYDDGSAYTEPTAAWDMNRITTLLRGRKISLTSPSEVQETKKSDESVLSKVSKSSLTSPTAAKANKQGGDTMTSAQQKQSFK